MTQKERIKLFEALFKDYNIQDCIAFDLKAITTWCIEHEYFTAPASTKYHGNYPGGLFDHSFAVANFLVGLTESEQLKWKRPVSPIIVGLFHDLCKVDAYAENMNGDYTYNNDMLLKGHGDKSVMMLSTLMQLTEEEVMCIRYHMGAFTDKEEWSDYTRAIHKYPNVLWTHTADMLAAHIANM